MKKTLSVPKFLLIKPFKKKKIKNSFDFFKQRNSFYLQYFFRVMCTFANPIGLTSMKLRLFEKIFPAKKHFFSFDLSCRYTVELR